MSGYILSPPAEADLLAIWRYTHANWSANQADIYIRLLHSGMEKVASDPRLGRACDHVRRGYRRYHIGSHVLYFHMTGGQVDIITVLHQSMDPQRHV